MSFEIVGDSADITFQFACSEEDLSGLEAALRGYFPALAIERAEGDLSNRLAGEYALVVDCGLSEEFMRPIKTTTSFDPDPLIALVGTLESLRPGESGLLQVLFRPTHFPWSRSILRAVSDGEGGSFFADAPEMLPLAREKTKYPLFAAVVRIAATAATPDRVWEIVRGMAGGLAQYTNPSSNELIPLSNDDYDPGEHFQDLLERTSRRSGMILNARELSGLVHPPSASLRSAKIRRMFKTTRSAAAVVRGHDYVLGENRHRGEATPVSLSLRQRLNHIHIIGATGTGKSTLLQNLIAQDLEAEQGLAVIDPHGDLIERVMVQIPRRRYKDVVIFDPADPENPSGINILSARGEAEKNVAASDLVSVFRRMSTSWGDQMTVVLGNAIQAFLESERGGTLIELRRFFIEPGYRTEFVRSVQDREIRYFWEQEHQLLRGNTIGSLLTRLGTFLRPKIIRRVVAPERDLDFASIMNHGKILLVKLAQGLIGEENSTLLGTLIVSKLHQAALSRQALPPADRIPFFLYIDEFQNFITPSLSGVLSGIRKYGLGLVLAHQDLRQLFDRDPGVANSVISNPGTRMCFRVGDYDAEKLEDGFAHFTAGDLRGLGLGEAITRVETSSDDFNLKVLPPKSIIPLTAKARRARLIELSHGKLVIDGKADIDSQISTFERSVSNREQVPSELFEGLLEDVHAPEIIAPQVPNLPPLPKSPKAIDDNKLSQHRYLQQLIKRLAEDRGYRAVIEEATPDGKGRVDVSLTRNGERIACEICVTTPVDQELHNIEKNLTAGYDKIVICASEKKKLERIQAEVERRFDAETMGKIMFFEPEGLCSYLEGTEVGSEMEQVQVKGYRVKVHYQPLSGVDRRRKRDAVAQVILNSFRSMGERR